MEIEVKNQEEFFEKVTKKTSEAAENAVKNVVDPIQKKLNDLDADFTTLAKEYRESKNVKHEEKKDNEQNHKDLVIKAIQSAIEEKEFQDYINNRSKRTPKVNLGTTVSKSVVSLTSDYSGGTVMVTGKSPIVPIEPSPKNIAEIMPIGAPEPGTKHAFLRVEYDNTAVGMLAENTASSAVSFSLIEDSVDVKRVSGATEISKRIFKSLPNAAAKILNYLPNALNHQMNFDILHGDGAGNNCKGLFEIAREASLAGKTFNAGAFASFSTYDSGTRVKINFAAAHGLIDGDTLTIANSTSYNHSYVVTVLNKKSIVITASYVADTNVASWTGTSVSCFYQSIKVPTQIDVIKAAVAISRDEELYNINTVLVDPVEYAKITMLKNSLGNYLIDDLTKLGVNLIPVKGIISDNFLLADWSENTLSLVPYGTAMQDSFSLYDDINAFKENKTYAAVEREFFLVVNNPYALIKGVFSTLITALTKS